MLASSLLIILISDDNINLRYTDGTTPLELACKNNYPSEVIQALIRRGARCDVRDADENTLLHLAAGKVRYTYADRVDEEARAFFLDQARALLITRRDERESPKKTRK